MMPNSKRKHLRVLLSKRERRPALEQNPPPLPSSGLKSSAAISPEEKIGQGDSPTELRFQTRTIRLLD